MNVVGSFCLNDGDGEMKVSVEELIIGKSKDWYVVGVRFLVFLFILIVDF